MVINKKVIIVLKTEHFEVNWKKNWDFYWINIWARNDTFNICKTVHRNIVSLVSIYAQLHEQSVGISFNLGTVQYINITKYSKIFTLYPGHKNATTSWYY